MVSASRRVGYLALLICLIGVTPGYAQRRLPEDNLAYPVLIQIGVAQGTAFHHTGGSGSGFYLNAPDGTYLVTARHVLFRWDEEKKDFALHGPAAMLISYPRDPKDPARNMFMADLPALIASKDLRFHPRYDVAVMKIGTPFVDTAGERRIRRLLSIALRESARSGILGVNIDTTKKYDDVLVGNDVFIFGYPTSLGLRSRVGSPQFDPLRPLLRAGVIAGTNPSNRTLILDCAVYHGNSGGPVLEVVDEVFKKTFRIVGVVSEFIPMEERSTNLRFLNNSGYAIATSIDAVLELIGTDNPSQ